MNSGWKGFFQRWLITAVGALAAAKIVTGVSADDPGALLAAALLLGILNAFIRPILMLISLPLLLLTLGLFTLIINATLFYFVGQVIKGFHVISFWAAFKGALVVSIVSIFANMIVGKPKAKVEIKTGRPSNRPKPPPDLGNGPVIDV